ncbi:hypothetical protein JTB14_037932 [Gonioctena quinquepunctata]|nr:hypothetical protein JTB14_037932 [Gonioctena quinquepunctata]
MRLLDSQGITQCDCLHCFSERTRRFWATALRHRLPTEAENQHNPMHCVCQFSTDERNGQLQPSMSRGHTEARNDETGIPRVLANQPPRTGADYTSPDEDSD